MAMDCAQVKIESKECEEPLPAARALPPCAVYAQPLAIDPAALEEETRAVLNRTATAMPVDHRHRWTTVRATSEWIVRAIEEGEKRGMTREEAATVEARAARVVGIVREVIAEVTAATIAQQRSMQASLEDQAPAEQVPTESADASADSKRRGRPPLKKPMFCMQCGTTSTPEWRRGERGPNTLCNACGLQFSKRRRVEREAKKRGAIDNVLNPMSEDAPLENLSEDFKSVQDMRSTPATVIPSTPVVVAPIAVAPVAVAPVAITASY